jgi:hypothetical protein
MDDLCETSASGKRNGHIFFPICLTFEHASEAEAIVQMLSGPTTIELGRFANGNPIHILVDVTRLIRNPPRDLKDALPTEFDYRGTAFPPKDATLGGIFPNGDFLAKLKTLGGLKNVRIQRAD